MKEQLLLKTQNPFMLILFVAVPVGFLFFSSDHNYNWAIGAILITLIFSSIRVGYFYKDRVVIKKAYLFNAKTIYYRDISKINFTPRILLSSSGFGIYYKAQNNKQKKVALDLDRYRFDELKKILLDNNPLIKITEWQKE